MKHFPATTLILDGIFGSHRRWEGLRRRLEKEVGPASIWRYANFGNRGLEELGEALAQKISGLAGPVNLVGYSMGGLVVREALRCAPHLEVRRVALLCSPHSGSLVAWCLPLKAVRQMRPRSAFLQRLHAAEWKPQTLAVWCPGDLMVLPSRSAKWDRAHHIHRCDIPAHAWPIYSKSIHQKIADFLAT